MGQDQSPKIKMGKLHCMLFNHNRKLTALRHTKFSNRIFFPLKRKFLKCHKFDSEIPDPLTFLQYMYIWMEFNACGHERPKPLYSFFTHGSTISPFNGIMSFEEFLEVSCPTRYFIFIILHLLMQIDAICIVYVK